MAVSSVLLLVALGIAGSNGAALFGIAHYPNVVAWWDKGSGADADFTCFTSQLLGTTRFVLGHHGQANYHGAANQMLAVSTADDASALAAPTGFWEVWNDKGSGADLDGTVARPICPEGYVSLGDIMFTSHGCCPQYLLDQIRCVKAEYAEETTIGDVIWADHGSGADQDLKVWGVTGAPGYFYANGNFAYPPPVKFYKLKSSAIDIW